MKRKRGKRQEGKKNVERGNVKARKGVEKVGSEENVAEKEGKKLRDGNIRRKDTEKVNE